MAAIRIEDAALKDPRFAVLGAKLKTTRFDALGRMAQLWSHCTEKKTYFLSAETIDALAEFSGFFSFILSPEIALAEETKKGIRIKGTKGRIEWLAKLRKSSKKGGDATKAKAKAKRLAKDKPSAGPNAEPKEGPLTLTIAPTLTKKNKNEESIGAATADALPALPGESGLQSVDQRSLSKAEAAAKANQFVAAYVKAYQARFPGGRPEDLNDGKVRGQIVTWIKDYPLKRACDLVQVYFQMEAKWFDTKGYDFFTFRNNLSKIGQALDSGVDPSGIDWSKVFGGTA